MFYNIPKPQIRSVQSHRKLAQCWDGFDRVSCLLNKRWSIVGTLMTPGVFSRTFRTRDVSWIGILVRVRIQCYHLKLKLASGICQVVKLSPASDSKLFWQILQIYHSSLTGLRVWSTRKQDCQHSSIFWFNHKQRLGWWYRKRPVI